MAKDQDAKHRIVEELAATRLELSAAGSIVKAQVNIPARVSTSLRRHSWTWISLAAIVGWILSRLPWRGKKVYLEGAGRSRLKREKARSGRRWDLGWAVWDGVWTVAKPLLTAYLTRKLSHSKPGEATPRDSR
jgi:hypothetical protein